ncbi:phenylacetate--CoA ligase family protein [Staphylococcus haemolyticus]|uniref:phenylacetate--CoA ligase family protein n=1 Tax=Staphylococcus haemolyticus TaxID=1283 RepID=UPI0015D89B95|nr:phenylacetate--CoA ligase family protein [Staphylococcus haemolyticus]MCH4518268.1 phenylacetate--CoA ligase family protein [Staphylococcus haemolyticus]MCH4534637.1 phenylacetate--CoA ligase family protein [Staphylococcus haemolyticus]
MLQFIYDHAPIAFQNIMVSVQGKLFEKQRYTSYYYDELEKLRDCQDSLTLQEERMKSFYKMIKKNSGYYNLKLKSFSDEIDLNNLKQYPLLTKEELRKHVKEIVIGDPKKLIKLGTGGTTGKSLRFYTSSYDMSRKIAYLDYFKEKHGVFRGMRRASVGGRKIIPKNQKKKVFWRYNEPLNQLLLSAYHLKEENLQYYIQKLNNFKPETLDGYTTALHRIAKYILDNEIKLDFKPIAIFPTAEALTDEMKRDIEKAFACPVRNQYASSEGAPFITENGNGDLELDLATGYFELEKVEGKIYELIVTGFYTTTTPLFRYKIGDSVELYEELPENYTQKDIKIRRIIGRNNDFFRTNDGNIITHVNLSSITRTVGGQDIIEAQYIQNTLNEINAYLVVNKEVNKTNIKNKLKKELIDRFGKATSITVGFIDEIPKTNGGKKRFMINNLK